MVGASGALRLVAVALLADGHALIEDVPGVGKTLLARAVARAIGLSFGRVQGTPDLLPGDVTGSSILEGNAFRFVPGPIFNQVVLVDEINRATPRTQSALLEAMQEHQASVDGVTRPLPEPFVVLATQNPIELEGTFALPEAQLDRFLLRIALGYPERRPGARHRSPLPGAGRAIGRRAGRLERRRTARPPRRGAHHPGCRRGGGLPGEPGPGHPGPSRRAARGVAAQQRGPVPRRAGLGGARGTRLRPPRRRAGGGLCGHGHRLLLDLDRELRGASVAGVVADVLAEVPVPLTP